MNDRERDKRDHQLEEFMRAQPQETEKKLRKALREAGLLKPKEPPP